jgi:hypothetical protein
MGATLKAKNLKAMIADRHYGIQGTMEHISDSLASGALNIKDPNLFSIRDLFRNLIEDGSELLEGLSRPKGGFNSDVMEAAPAGAGDFSNITGQLIFNLILSAYQNPQFIGDQLVTTMPSSFLDEEKLAGIGSVGSGEFGQDLKKGDAYPYLGLSEEWVTLERSETHGGIVPIHVEDVIADRTFVLQQRARQAGEKLGMFREVAILKVVLGIVNTYKRNGTATNTYLTSGAYTNDRTDNPLVDWTDVDLAEKLLSEITDPSNADPTMCMPNTIVVPRALLYTAKRIVSATELRSGDITAAPGNQTVSSNVLGNYNVLSNPLVKTVTTSDTKWFLGEPKKAFVWKEVQPLEVKQDTDSSEVSFTHDIIMRFRARYRGVPGVLDPRFMSRNGT